MSENNKDPREVQFNEDLAMRLKLAVEAIGLPKGEIAASINVGESRFSNWLGNHNRPDWFAIHKFCRRYGVTADWLVLGEISRLPRDLADSLEAALAEKTEVPQGESRPRRGRPKSLKTDGI